ncbi:hypothetical protein CAC42_678 [Sphaceloma murrayae]|uniref:RNase III domain-containing protein n=1 Tax=Sphaceloma murrayae TaxID=2082308 RepID=A0A2K1QKK4_9PEZI|nr:hypothetical protein CAC42_678 [Sphaceloma murrayae]
MKRKGEDEQTRFAKKQKTKVDPKKFTNGQSEVSEQNASVSTNDHSLFPGVVSPEAVDSLGLLDVSLTTLATDPELVSSLLGATALEPMKHLLSLLRTRNNATSLPNLFPEAYPIRAQVPSNPVISPFTPNTTYPFTLPTLPAIGPGPLSKAPFIHRSANETDRVTGLPLPIDPQTNGTAPAAIEANYERLEFLGDAYLELFASLLITTRFPDLTAGRQSRLRETLVNNETLMRFSRAYGFDNRLQARGFETQIYGREQAKSAQVMKGNKGLNKILADVFEAYVAALVLSDPKKGFERTQAWLWELWTPLLVEHAESIGGGASIAVGWEKAEQAVREGIRERGRGVERVGAVSPRGASVELVRRVRSSTRSRSRSRSRSRERSGPRQPARARVTARQSAERTERGPGSDAKALHDIEKRPSKSDSKNMERQATDAIALADMRKNQASTNPYNPSAKVILQKRIAPASVRLVYRDYQKPKQLKSACIFFQEVALNGWGYENKVLGKGEGESKGEAGNRAATDAMNRQKAIIEECETRWADEKIRKQRERETAEKKDSTD